MEIQSTGMALPDFPWVGGCVCADVRYRVNGAPLSVYACHCKDCQRFSGGPFSLAMVVRREDFVLESGEPSCLAKPADSGRIVGVRFCANCGTRLWHDPAHSPRVVNIAAGTLDDISWAQPSAHVWTARKVPWIDLGSAAVLFEGQPATREPLYDAWNRAKHPAGVR